MIKSQSENTSRFYKGTKPIPSTRWKVFTTAKNGVGFVEIGTVFVAGKRVSREMDEHLSIKGYMPHDIARKIAHRKYPKANPIIVEQIYEDEE